MQYLKNTLHLFTLLPLNWSVKQYVTDNKAVSYKVWSFCWIHKYPLQTYFEIFLLVDSFFLDYYFRK